jgi:hypothetical protein
MFSDIEVNLPQKGDGFKVLNFGPLTKSEDLTEDFQK